MHFTRHPATTVYASMVTLFASSAFDSLSSLPPLTHTHTPTNIQIYAYSHNQYNIFFTLHLCPVDLKIFLFFFFLFIFVFLLLSLKALYRNTYIYNTQTLDDIITLKRSDANQLQGGGSYWWVRKRGRGEDDCFAFTLLNKNKTKLREIQKSVISYWSLESWKK